MPELFGDDRGVSESLGFVFVFVMIVSTVGVVFGVGYGGLEDTRDVERVNNAERAFDVLAANVGDIVREGAPSRATEIKLADATLLVDDPTVVNVTVRNATGRIDPSSPPSYDVDPIVYDPGTGSKIVYVQGAVIRQQGGGSTMLSPPSMVFDEVRALVPVVQTRGDEVNAIGGSQTVLVRTDHSTTDLVVSEQRGDFDVTVNVTSPRATAWRRYFKDRGLNCADLPDERAKVSCEYVGAERVSIPVVRIDIAYE